jgi:hypothetical protein
MLPVANDFEDPWGRSVALPTYNPAIRVVAHTVGAQYTAVTLADALGLYSYGTAHLGAGYDYTGADSWSFNMVELEKPPSPIVRGWGVEDQDNYGGTTELIRQWKIQVSPSGNPANWTEALGLPDVYLRDTGWQCRYFYLGFFAAGAQYNQRGDIAYQLVTRDTVRTWALQNGPLNGGAEAVALFGTDDIFFFRTNEGRAGKLIVRSSYTWWSDAGNWCNNDMYFDYVVYPL